MQPLLNPLRAFRYLRRTATWRSGYAAVCKFYLSWFVLYCQVLICLKNIAPPCDLVLPCYA